MLIMKMKIKTLLTKTWPWILITVGSVMASLGYAIFVLPMNMVEGGVTGLGIIAQRLTGLPIVGTTSIVLTAIVFVFATRILGKSFGARSIYAMILVNVLIDLFVILKFKVITHDMLLSAFYGGSIVGIGMGMIYFSGASTGGADAAAQILWKLKRIPLGRTLIIIDIFVLGAATLLFIPIEKIMYSLIFIFIEIKAIDMVLDGVHANQRVLVITKEPDKIRDCIIDTLNRGVTIFKGTGGYSGEDRYMLTTVIPRKNIPEIRRIIASTDHGAFVIIEDVNQVFGEGFDTLPRHIVKDKEK
jgi:uncharacterized membrane-anchored protein YitT (DUF2179 family)